VNEVLQDAHGDAWSLGRRRAGVDGARNDDDDFLGRGIADQEMSDFFGDFIDRVAEGDPRYVDADGNLRLSNINARLDMYAHRMRGTANESFVLNSPRLSTFIWRLGDAEHCDDCIAMAADSPYTADNLWTYPGAGETECLTHCKCVVVRWQDGVTGFRPK